MESQGQSPFFLTPREDKKHLLLRYFVVDSPATNPVCLCCFHRDVSTAAAMALQKLVPCFAASICTSTSFWARCRKEGVWKASYTLQSHLSLSLWGENHQGRALNPHSFVSLFFKKSLYGIFCTQTSDMQMVKGWRYFQMRYFPE